RVHGIAEGIEDCSSVMIHKGIMAPNIRHRQSNEFREASGAVHADCRSIRTEMPHTRHTMPASPARDVAFTGNQFSGLEVVDVGADLDDLSHEFMANRHGNRDRLASPVVPIEDMNVGSANPRT